MSQSQSQLQALSKVLSGLSDPSALRPSMLLPALAQVRALLIAASNDNEQSNLDKLALPSTLLHVMQLYSIAPPSSSTTPTSAASAARSDSEESESVTELNSSYGEIQFACMDILSLLLTSPARCKDLVSLHDPSLSDLIQHHLSSSYANVGYISATFACANQLLTHQVSPTAAPSDDEDHDSIGDTKLVPLQLVQAFVAVCDSLISIEPVAALQGFLQTTLSAFIQIMQQQLTAASNSTTISSSAESGSSSSGAVSRPNAVISAETISFLASAPFLQALDRITSQLSNIMRDESSNILVEWQKLYWKYALFWNVYFEWHNQLSKSQPLLWKAAIKSFVTQDASSSSSSSTNAYNEYTEYVFMQAVRALLHAVQLLLDRKSKKQQQQESEQAPSSLQLIRQVCTSLRTLCTTMPRAITLICTPSLTNSTSEEATQSLDGVKWIIDVLKFLQASSQPQQQQVSSASAVIPVADTLVSVLRLLNTVVLNRSSLTKADLEALVSSHDGGSSSSSTPSPALYQHSVQYQLIAQGILPLLVTPFLQFSKTSTVTAAPAASENDEGADKKDDSTREQPFVLDSAEIESWTLSLYAFNVLFVSGKWIDAAATSIDIDNAAQFQLPQAAADNETLHTTLRISESLFFALVNLQTELATRPCAIRPSTEEQDQAAVITSQSLNRAIAATLFLLPASVPTSLFFMRSSSSPAISNEASTTSPSDSFSLESGFLGLNLNSLVKCIQSIAQLQSASSSSTSDASDEENTSSSTSADVDAVANLIPLPRTPSLSFHCIQSLLVAILRCAAFHPVENEAAPAHLKARCLAALPAYEAVSDILFDRIVAAQDRQKQLGGARNSNEGPDSFNFGKLIEVLSDTLLFMQGKAAPPEKYRLGSTSSFRV